MLNLTGSRLVIITVLLLCFTAGLPESVVVHAASGEREGGPVFQPAWSVEQGYQTSSDAGALKEKSTGDSAFPAVVETRWLADNPALSDIRKVFVDNWPSDKTAFDKGHLPGSSFMSVDRVMDVIGNGSVPPDREKFNRMMREMGIGNDEYVVMYGAAGKSVFTLGAFWLMDYFGHDKTGYLNGGLAEWIDEKGELSDVIERFARSDYSASLPDESIRAEAAYVLENLHNPDVVIVDVRSPGEYRGETNDDKNKRTGHIPGAVNISYYVTNFNADNGTLKSPQSLRDLYSSHGVTGDKEIIVYCQGGIRAANTFFVLKHLLHYPRVRNYVGSWGEWGNRVDFDLYPAEK